ncbi:heterokaryon incompatibility protein-domain-containing protein [Xylaria telfairii]|nr:heterokaryon incompatibility protein-domain-containing protein [Xylaria telfairii]
MRLLQVNTLKLTDFSSDKPPRYAILSHCWRHGLNEILYEDVEYSKPDAWREKKKEAAEKVINACALARSIGYEYIWIDTCCIDKRSSSELSEAINSMYSWYRHAGVCLAFLDDVDGLGDLHLSRWFTRGWTLQELIAPDNVWFYNKSWCHINDRFSMAKELSAIITVDEAVLRHGHEPNPTNWADHKWRDRGGYRGNFQACVCSAHYSYSDTLREVLDGFSIATVMSWAAWRETSRVEDTAYCLMGLFDINMPLLYGEGRKAFRRLQEEIIRRNNDQSILLWLREPGELPESLDLASSPTCFFPLDIKKYWLLDDTLQWLNGYETRGPYVNNFLYGDDMASTPQMNTAKEGLEVNVLLVSDYEHETYWAIPNCTIGNNPLARPAIALKRILGSGNEFERESTQELFIFTLESPLHQGRRYRKLTIPANRSHVCQSELTSLDVNMRNATVTRIILRDKQHGSTYLQNRFSLPPLRIVADCSGDKYTGQCWLPDFDEVHQVTPVCNDSYGLVLLKVQGQHHFFVAWGVVNPDIPRVDRHDKSGIWCKILPASDALSKIFVTRQQIDRKIPYDREYTLLRAAVSLGDVTRRDKLVLDFGVYCCEILAQTEPDHFMGNAFVELTISVDSFLLRTAGVEGTTN